MPPQKLYQQIASLLLAILNCETSGNGEWSRKHEERILQLVRDYAPSGSGFDNGTTIDLERSQPDRLVFHTSFHHMNGGGYYDGWTEHTVTVRPSLAFGYILTISGRNRNDIKDMIHESFSTFLNTETGR